MIRFVTGDILLSQAKVVAHGVAPNDSFNQGLAHAMREQVPAMYKDFRHFCQGHHPKPGEIWTWGGPDGVRIVALFTQEPAHAPGGLPGKASTTSVNHALRALASECRTHGWPNVALPRLATGVGGLDWSEVKPLIEKQLGGLGIPIVVYEHFRAGQVADEGLPE